MWMCCANEIEKLRRILGIGGGDGGDSIGSDHRSDDKTSAALVSSSAPRPVPANATVSFSHELNLIASRAKMKIRKKDAPRSWTGRGKVRLIVKSEWLYPICVLRRSVRRKSVHGICYLLEHTQCTSQSLLHIKRRQLRSSTRLK